MAEIIASHANAAGRQPRQMPNGIHGAARLQPPPAQQAGPGDSGGMPLVRPLPRIFRHDGLPPKSDAWLSRYAESLKSRKNAGSQNSKQMPQVRNAPAKAGLAGGGQRNHGCAARQIERETSRPETAGWRAWPWRFHVAERSTASPPCAATSRSPPEPCLTALLENLLRLDIGGQWWAVARWRFGLIALFAYGGGSNWPKFAMAHAAPFASSLQALYCSLPDSACWAAALPVCLTAKIGKIEKKLPVRIIANRNL